MSKIKKTKAFLFLLLSIQCLFISCKKDVDTSPTDCESDIFFSDNCITFEVDELEIIAGTSQYFLKDNANFSIDFEQESEAVFALEVIQNYGFNEYCIIGSNTSFYYFLSNGTIPSGEFSGDDCIPHVVCDLTVELTSSGKYTLVDGERWLYAGDSEEEALQILQTVQHFQSNFGCYVGRPQTDMHYLRK